MALKRVEVDIYVWEGVVTAQPSAPAYSINKNVISGQTNITLEIAELVRDYLTMTFNNDYTSMVPTNPVCGPSAGIMFEIGEGP